jgi:hypothetical protein
MGGYGCSSRDARRAGDWRLLRLHPKNMPQAAKDDTSNLGLVQEGLV